MEMTRHEQLKIACKKFHKDHPEVWKQFARLTFDRIALGHKNYSADAIFHRIRWEMTLPTYEKGKEFKLNDHYTAFYARAFMKKYPEHDGFFKLRAQKSRAAPVSRRSPLPPPDIYPPH